MKEQPMVEQRTIRPDEDPVCGMTVDIVEARAAGRVVERDGREYVFCGRGCLLDFREDPAKYLAADFSPSM
jgi:YHS domain-containing protein